jgi:hypothetical protein
MCDFFGILAIDVAKKHSVSHQKHPVLTYQDLGVLKYTVFGNYHLVEESVFMISKILCSIQIKINLPAEFLR